MLKMKTVAAMAAILVMMMSFTAPAMALKEIPEWCEGAQFVVYEPQCDPYADSDSSGEEGILEILENFFF